VTVAGTLI